MRARTVTVGLLSGLIAAFALSLLLGSMAAGGLVGGTPPAKPPAIHPTVPSSTFVAGAPAGLKGPDDLTSLPGSCMVGTGVTLWTAYQNGINPNGTAGAPGGIDHSVVTGYAIPSGIIVQMINVTGKVDGLTSDPARCVLLATINEDSNSSFAVVDPNLGTVTEFRYSPSPTVGGNGGTDSIALWHQQIVVSHSNPNDPTQATAYSVLLSWSSHTAYLTPLFYDDSTARDVTTGANLAMALTDPDSNFVMPHSVPRFAGDLATVSQADGRLILAGTSPHGHLHLWQLNLTDNVSGNLPPIDGIAAATTGNGTLYVVDSGANSIYALSTSGLPAGTVFVGEPNDNNNPLVGTLDLNTGKITPFANHFVSPKFMLFVPAPGSAHGHHGGHDGEGGDDDGEGDHGGDGHGHDGWSSGAARDQLRAERN